MSGSNVRCEVSLPSGLWSARADEGQIVQAEAEALRDEMVTGHGRVLVMEDEESVRSIVGNFVARLGYSVALAADGAEAVRLFREAFDGGDPFDVAILDLTVPGGMGGKKAVERLLEIDPRAKAIVSSGYSDDPVLADFESYGFTGAIRKPYEVIGLSKLLNEVLYSGVKKAR